MCVFDCYTSTRGSVLFSYEIYEIEIVDGFDCDGDRLSEEMRAAATTITKRLRNGACEKKNRI